MGLLKGKKRAQLLRIGQLVAGNDRLGMRNNVEKTVVNSFTAMETMRFFTFQNMFQSISTKNEKTDSPRLVLLRITD